MQVCSLPAKKSGPINVYVQAKLAPTSFPGVIDLTAPFFPVHALLDHNDERYLHRFGGLLAVIFTVSLIEICLP